MIIEDLLGETVGDSYQVRIPTYVNVSRKNLKPCNLNVYRNLHHHHLNTQKKNFSDEVSPLLRDKPRAERIWIHYKIFAPRNGRLDTMNVGTVIDKYFSDTLVEAGKIPDDDYTHIVLSTFSFGGVVPLDGHAIATVNILKEESKPMRVMLDEEDIHQALDAYVKTLNITGATGVEITVNDDGEIEAEVLMGDVKPKNKGGRPRGSKNKTRSKPTSKDEGEDTNVDEDGDDTSEGSSDSDDSGGDQPQEDASEEREDKPSFGSKSGNLFGDSDEKESSDSPTNSEETQENTGPKVMKRKSSIFDAQ